MSSLIPSGSASGTGSMTLAAPVTNSNQTATLPDATGNIVVAGANSAITSGTAVASTSGTSIDFTSIPSWVKRITVMFNAVSTSGTSFPQIQIGSGSVITSGYLWRGGYLATSSVIGASFTSGFVVRVDDAAAVISGSVVLTTLGSNVWTATMSIGSITYGAIMLGGGGITLGGALDRVRITTVNGTDTFDAGSINILWE